VIVLLGFYSGIIIHSFINYVNDQFFLIAGSW